MKAAFIATASHDCRIESRDVAKPKAGPGQVLIECHYGGLNWGDTEIARGVYPGQVAEIPYVARENIIPGTEVSGRVAGIGEGVEGIAVGQVVAAMSSQLTGGYAEFLVTEAELVVPLPIDAPTADAACLIGVGVTAYHLLFSAYRIEPHDTILVHSISGGVGLALTQLASEIGATVLGTTSSAAKVEQALTCGARRVFIREQQDFVAGVREETDGRGVDLVIDSLGGQILLDSIDALAVHGRLINIGNTGGSGRPGSLKGLHDSLYPRCASYQAFDVFHSAPPNSAQWRTGIDYLVERFVDGRLRLPVAQVFPLEQCEAMFAAMRTGLVSGKLCLEIH